MDLLEVLTNIRSSGSGTGCSHYMRQCAARVNLNIIHGDGDAAGFDAQVGTLVHKLLDLHYTRQLRDVAIPLDDLANCEENPVQEALRIYAAYTKYFADDEFDVLACELQIPEVKDGVLTPQGILQKEFLAEFLVDPFTFRPDMVVSFSQAQADLWLERRGYQITPGVYLIDHKTHKKAATNALRDYSMGPQVPLYTRLYNELCNIDLMTLNGVAQQPCQGLIINSMVRHTDMTPIATARRAASFSSFVLDVGTDKQLSVYRSFFRTQKEYFATGRPNPTACQSFGRVCQYYETGQCDRFTPVLAPVTVEL